MDNYCARLTPLKRLYCRRLVAKNKVIVSTTTKNLKTSSRSSSSSSSSCSSSRKGYRKSSGKYQCKKEVFYIKLLKNKLKNIDTAACATGELCTPVDDICDQDGFVCVDEDEERCPNGKQCLVPDDTTDCDLTANECVPNADVCDTDANTCVPNADVCDLLTNECVLPTEVCDSTANECVPLADVCAAGNNCIPEGVDFCNLDGQSCYNDNEQCGDTEECADSTLVECANQVRILFAEKDECLKSNGATDSKCNSSSSKFQLVAIGNKYLVQKDSKCLQSDGTGNEVLFEDCDPSADEQLFKIYRESSESNWKIEDNNGNFLDYDGTDVKFEDSDADDNSVYLLNTCIEN